MDKEKSSDGQKSPEELAAENAGLKKALQKERAKRQIAERMSRKKPGGEESNKSVIEDDLSLTHEDLVDGNDEAVNERFGKVKGGIHALEQRLAQLESGHAVDRAEVSVETVMNKFAIFSDEDEQLADDAARALAAEVENAGNEAPVDEATLMELAKGVSQRYSRYKVKKSDEAGGAESGGKVAPESGGSAAAAHLKETVERPKDSQDARKKGKGIIAGFVDRLASKGK